MRVVHHHARAMRLGDPDDLRQVRHVAAHGEHAVHHHERAAVGRHAVEAGGEIGHVVVLEAEELAEAQLAARVDAGVVFAVADDVVVQADDGADDAGVRLEAGAEGERRLAAEERRELLLQLDVQVERAVEEAGARASGAVLLERLDAGLDHLRADREAQIVVRAKHDSPPALHHHFRILTGLEPMEERIKPCGATLVRLLPVVALLKNVHDEIIQVFGRFGNLRGGVAAGAAYGRRPERTTPANVRAAPNAPTAVRRSSRNIQANRMVIAGRE